VAHVTVFRSCFRPLHSRHIGMKWNELELVDQPVHYPPL
jgi:hypothetical protein